MSVKAQILNDIKAAMKSGNGFERDTLRMINSAFKQIEVDERVAMDMKLPIVPITINGPFDVLKANSMKFTPGRLEMVIHKPIPTENLETKDLRDLMNQTKEIIYADLWDKYK